MFFIRLIFATRLLLGSHASASHIGAGDTAPPVPVTLDDITVQAISGAQKLRSFLRMDAELVQERDDMPLKHRPVVHGEAKPMVNHLHIDSGAGGRSTKRLQQEVQHQLTVWFLRVRVVPLPLRSNLPVSVEPRDPLINSRCKAVVSTEPLVKRLLCRGRHGQSPYLF